MSKLVWIFIFYFISNYTITVTTASPPKFPLTSKVVTNQQYLTLPSLGELGTLLENVTEDTTINTRTADNILHLTSAVTDQTLLEEATLKQDEITNARNIVLEAKEYTIPDINDVKINEMQRKNGDETILDKNKHLNIQKQTQEPVGVTQKSSINSQILSKIESALSKSKASRMSQTIPEVPAPNMVPIFKPKCNNLPRNENDGNLIKPSAFGTKSNSENSHFASQINNSSAANNSSNQDSNCGNFVITGAFLKPLFNPASSNIPKSSNNYGAYAVSTKTTSKSDAKSVNVAPSTKLKDIRLINISPLPKTANTDPVTINLGSLNPIQNQIDQWKQVPNANLLLNKDYQKKNAAVVLFKPETVSLERFYGNFLKKLTLTVLVPFYVSRITV